MAYILSKFDQTLDNHYFVKDTDSNQICVQYLRYKKGILRLGGGLHDRKIKIWDFLGVNSSSSILQPTNLNLCKQFDLYKVRLENWTQKYEIQSLVCVFPKKTKHNLQNFVLLVLNCFCVTINILFFRKIFLKK